MTSRCEMVSPQLTESSHFIAMIKTDFNDSIKNIHKNSKITDAISEFSEITAQTII